MAQTSPGSSQSKRGPDEDPGTPQPVFSRPVLLIAMALEAALPHSAMNIEDFSRRMELGISSMLALRSPDQDRDRRPTLEADHIDGRYVPYFAPAGAMTAVPSPRKR